MAKGTAEDRWLGQRIRSQRLRRKLTQAKLAKRVRVDAKTISLIERGLVRVGVSFRSRVARALNVSVTHFIDWSG